MKDFCMMVQKLRRNSRSDFEDKMFKLILNALYGKTIENEENFCNSSFITDPKIFRREMKETTRIKTLSLISPNMVFMMKKRREYEFFSHVGVGFSVLGLSKWMVSGYWARMKEKYGDEVRAIQTDTDSVFRSCIITIFMVISRRVWMRRED